jgi:hypothetical protein
MNDIGGGRGFGLVELDLDPRRSDLGWVKVPLNPLTISKTCSLHPNGGFRRSSRKAGAPT